MQSRCGDGCSQGRQWTSAAVAFCCWMTAQSGSRRQPCSSCGHTYGCCCWSPSGRYAATAMAGPSPAARSSQGSWQQRSSSSSRTGPGRRGTSASTLGCLCPGSGAATRTCRQPNSQPDGRQGGCCMSWWMGRDRACACRCSRVACDSHSSGVNSLSQMQACLCTPYRHLDAPTVCRPAGMVCARSNISVCVHMGASKQLAGAWLGPGAWAPRLHCKVPSIQSCGGGGLSLNPRGGTCQVVPSSCRTFKGWLCVA